MNPGDFLQRWYEVTGYFPRGNGAQKEGRCPGPMHAHGDRKPSMSARIENDRVLFHCHVCGDAGKPGILEALGLTEADLFSDDSKRENQRSKGNDNWTPCGHGRAAEYEYHDEQGTLLYGVTRCPQKCFAQWRPDPMSKSGRRWSLKNERGELAVRLVPYRLPWVLEAIADDRVAWVVEGEKDVQTLTGLGLVATCNSGGAGKWTEQHAAYFKGADVRVVADRDEPGRRHAMHVVETLLPISRSIDVVQARFGKDATDHLDGGGQLHDFVPVWEPKPFVLEEAS